MRKKSVKDDLDYDDYKSFKKWEDYLSEFKGSEVKERRGIKPISDWCSHVAVFYGNHGEYIGQKKLNYNERYFEYKGGNYNFIPEKASFMKRVGIIMKTKYYHYNIGEPMPLLFDRKVRPVISADVYKMILDSDLVKKLNPKKMSLLDLVGGWKGIILILVIGAIIYYLVSGGDITATTQ